MNATKKLMLNLQLFADGGAGGAAGGTAGEGAATGDTSQAAAVKYGRGCSGRR